VSRHKPLEDAFGLEFGLDEAPTPEGYWAVVRHADVRSISRNPQDFCSGKGVITLDVPAEIIEATLSDRRDANRTRSLRLGRVAQRRAGSGARGPAQLRAALLWPRLRSSF